MRRGRVGLPLQVTEHDRRPQTLGQTVDLLVEDLAVGIIGPREVDLRRPLGDDPVEPASAGRASAARVATRCATPNSQLATDPARRIDPARLARTMKTAWKASSAS